MNDSLRILMLEDEPADAELNERALRKANIAFTTLRVATREAFLQALDEFQPDIALLDYKLPAFDGSAALALLRKQYPEIPAVMVTGALGDEAAIELLKAGAKDYVLKDNLLRLAPAVQHALSEERGVRARKAAEANLRQAEEKYRSLFESSHDGIALADLQGKFTDCNQVFLDMLGYTREELLELTYPQINVPEVQAINAEIIETQVLTRGYTDELERDLIRKDGTLVPTSLKVFSKRDDSGAAVGLWSVVRDITDRKKAQSALAASERRFRTLTENVSDIIAILSMDGNVIYISPSVSAIAGYAPEELVGRNMLEFIHPDEQEIAVQLMAQLLREPGAIQRGLRRFQHQNGDWVILEHITSNQLANPDVEGIITILRDVTEQQQAEAALRESERRFSTLLQNVQLVSIMLDHEARITNCNDYFLKLVGWSREDVLGKDWFELLIPPEAHADVRKTMTAMLADRPDAWHHQNEILTRSGERRLINWNNTLLRSASGEAIGTSSIGEDITERRRGEEALRASKQLIESILNAIPVRVFWKDRNLVFQGGNTLFAQDAGFDDPQALIGKNDSQMVWGEQAELYRADDRKVIDSGQAKMLIEEPQTTPDGKIITLLTSKVPLRDAHGDITGVLGAYMDITDFKHRTWALNERIKESQCLHRISNLASQPNLDEDGLLRESLEPLVAGFQYPEITCARIVSKDHTHATANFRETPWRLAVDLSVSGTTEGHIEVHYLEERPPAAEGPFLTEERVLLEDVAHTLGRALTDLRSRLKLADQVRRFQAQSDALTVALSSDALQQGDVEQLARQVNELVTQTCSAERANIWLFKEDESELHCIDLYEATPKQHSAGMVLKESEFQNEFQALKTSRFINADDPLTDPRTTGYVENYLKPLGITSMLDVMIRISGRHAGLLCIEHVGRAHHWENDEIAFAIQLADQIGFALTTARQLEDASSLQRVNRVLKTLSAGNSAVVHAKTEQQLLQDMCQVLVKRGGYKMVWVGYAESDDAKSLRPVAWAGAGVEYVQQANISWAETARGLGPTGRCIRSGKSQVVRNIAADPTMAPWHEQALKHGYQSSLALPLVNEWGVFGVLMIYSVETEAFDPEELALLEEMAGDLAYGITTLRTRSAHEAGLHQLQRSMEGTVQALASTVEMRDPYTAGHQLRVANLAVAMAREMGLSDERIQGLDLAARIHDIGKIQIPTDILNKPGKLTENEFNLIKEHAQSGYEILKGVTFPWPIADIIRQHHERLDGSGYPQGLKGDDILLEARILAVADTIEAMSSHRPYRPARGLEASLEVIQQDRGTKLDADAVDACLTLFRDKDYEMAVWQTD